MQRQKQQHNAAEIDLAPGFYQGYDMTRLREAPNGKDFVMQTMFPKESFRTLESLPDFGLTTTDAVNQVIGVHMGASNIRAAGGILLAKTAKRLEIVGLPELIEVVGHDLNVWLINHSAGPFASRDSL